MPERNHPSGDHGQETATGDDHQRVNGALIVLRRLRQVVPANNEHRADQEHDQAPTLHQQAFEQEGPQAPDDPHQEPDHRDGGVLEEVEVDGGRSQERHQSHDSSDVAQKLEEPAHRDTASDTPDRHRESDQRQHDPYGHPHARELILDARCPRWHQGGVAPGGDLGPSRVHLHHQQAQVGRHSLPAPVHGEDPGSEVANHEEGDADTQDREESVELAGEQVLLHPQPGTQRWRLGSELLDVGGRLVGHRSTNLTRRLYQLTMAEMNRLTDT